MFIFTALALNAQAGANECAPGQSAGCIKRIRNAQGTVVREISYDAKGRAHGLSKFWTADGKPDGSRCYLCGEKARVEECATRIAQSCDVQVAETQPLRKRASATRMPASH